MCIEILCKFLIILFIHLLYLVDGKFKSPIINIFGSKNNTIPINIFGSRDPKIVGEIFLNHGVAVNELQDAIKCSGMTSKSKTENPIIQICNSIDGGKSNRIYGDAVCFYACTELHGDKFVLSKRAKCVQSGVKVKHTGNKTVTNNYIEELRLAECVCKNHTSGIEESFHITNGPAQHYFYVFRMQDQESKKVAITACLFLPNVKINVIKKIKIQETYDKLEADDIFGLYGQNCIPRSNNRMPNHICKNVSQNPKATPEEIYCRKAMESSYLIRKQIRSLQTPVKCVPGAIERRNFLIDDTLTRYYDGLQMIECKHSTGSFFILNGPTKNLFYITDIRETRTDGSDMCRIASIDAVMRINIPTM